MADMNQIEAIDCPCCSHRISPRASRCPLCGDPINEVKERASGFSATGVVLCVLSGLGFWAAMKSSSSEGSQIWVVAFASMFLFGCQLVAIGGMITLLRRIGDKL